jgi:two-component system sensor histidine kinase PilS (NtrC family)
MLSHLSALNDEQRQLIDIVIRESNRLNSIITDFLAYSREKSYKFARVDLIPLLEDALVLLENRLHATELRIVRHFSVNQAFAVADGDRMKQVFWNLLENAARAMDQKGTITVSVREVEDRWQISFRDTGSGIAPQLLEKIFEPFQSNFEGGTGLGLAIVYQIVQAHGAKISVQSQPGEGAEFTLEILHARAAGSGRTRALPESAETGAEVSHG